MLVQAFRQITGQAVGGGNMQEPLDTERAGASQLAHFEPLEPRLLLSTFTSIADGDWSDANTWDLTGTPGDGDTVIIAQGHEVTYDQSVSGILGDDTDGGLIIRGKLVFDADTSLTLRLDENLHVDGGELEMRPSGANVEHAIVFENIDESQFVGGGMSVLATDVGLWVTGHGMLDVVGASKTPWTHLTGSAYANDTTITVKDATGWQVGDEIVITPTQAPTVGDASWLGFDERVITAINGSTITLDAGLTFDHPEVNDTWTAEVLNLTRNVKIGGTGDGSMSPQNNGRAHLMFLHTHHAQTVKNLELRHMGPRDSEGILGRYGLHVHWAQDGSRGSLFENIVVHDSGNHAFVPHASHGVTMRGTIAHNTYEDAYWWDNQDATDDLLWDYAVASMTKDNNTPEDVRNSGFTLGIGTNMTISNSVAVGVQGLLQSSGFKWPEFANGFDNNVWVFNENNVSHNNTLNGIHVWQNDDNDHVVANFDAYHNGTIGINHGAYLNDYRYENLRLYGNGEMGFQMHPNSNYGTEMIVLKNVHIDGGGISPYALQIVKHRASTGQHTLVVDSHFEGYTNTAVDIRSSVDHPHFVQFVDTTFEPNTNHWHMVDEVHAGSVIRVKEVDGTQYELRRYDQQGDTYNATWNAQVTYLPDYQASPYSGFEFVDDFTGVDGSPWPAGWTVDAGGNIVTIQGSEGEVRNNGSNTPSIITTDDSAVSAQNVNSSQQVDLKASIASLNMTGGLIARRSDGNPDTYYRANFDNNSAGTSRWIEITRVVDGYETVIATTQSSGVNEWSSQSFYTMKFEVEQLNFYTTELRMKVWQVGTAEPTEWSLTVVDQGDDLQRVEGRGGIYARTHGTSRVWWFDNYSVEALAAQAPDTTAPSAPASPAATADGQTEIDLDWADNTEGDLSHYNVYRGTSPGVTASGANLIATDLTSSTFSDTNLSPNTTYYYIVTAVDLNDNESLASGEVSATTDSLAMIAEDWTGSNGSSWSNQWTGQAIGGTVFNLDIQNGEGRLHKPYQAPDGRAIAYINSATGTDVDQLSDFRTGENGAGFGLFARGIDTDSDGNIDTFFYAFAHDTWDKVLIYKQDSSGFTQLGAVSKAISHNVDYRMRFEVTDLGGDDVQLRAKLWTEGSSEPTGWDVTVVTNDSQMANQSGRFGIVYGTYKHREIFTDNYEADILTV